MKRLVLGLSLLELVVVLAMLAVLLAVGVPMYRTMTANAAASSDSAALFGALQLGRSEAISRKVNVSVCAKRAPAAMDVQCALDNSSWANGFLVIAETATGGAEGTNDAGDTLVRVFSDLASDLAVATAADFVTFRSDGSVVAAATLQLQHQSARGAPLRCIRVARSGSLRNDEGGCP